MAGLKAVYNMKRKDVRMNVSRVLRLATACMVAAAFIAAAGTGAWAKDTPKLELKIVMEKEIRSVKDGKEVVERTPAGKVKPGEMYVYTVTYTNTGKGEARNAKIVDVIPKGMVYVAGSAEGKDATVTCSIDGGKSFHAPPVKYKAKKPDGKTEEKEAEPSMYTHIKWMVKSVQPGASGTVSFRANVEK